MNYTLRSLITVSFIFLGFNYASACDCRLNATASGSDFGPVYATIDNFTCTGGAINNATLGFTIQGSCSSTYAKIIVNGTIVAQDLCSVSTFDLTPYLPLTSVSVVAYDNPGDNTPNYVTVDMSITLNGSTTTNGPLSAFSAADHQCYGTPIQFTNNSVCAYGYNWSFGDGTYSNEFEPTHTYSQPGYYWVGLQILDAGGYTIGNENHYVIVSGSLPTMNLSSDTVCVGDNVNFHDNAFFSSANGVSYLIDFGDGNTATSNNYWGSFNHSYAAVGDYTVTLTVNSNCGTQIIDTVVHVGNDLQVSSYLQVGSSGSSPSVFCPGTEVNLYTDWSLNYLFNYGDGTSGTQQGHIYNAAGTYTPTVTVQNGCGNSATYSGGPIVIGSLPFYSGNPYTGTNGPSSVCPNETVRFYASHASSYSWTFGDGGTSTFQEPQHTYMAPGQYAVSVTLTDGCGNDTTLYQTIYVSTDIGIGDVSLEVQSEICTGDAFSYNVNGAYQYEQSGSFVWSFGDGATSTTRQGYHSYSIGGTYDVTCTITNACGNSITLSTQITAGSNVPPQNMDIFTIQDIFCPGDEVMLLATPYSASNTVVWNMGDGSIVNATDTIAVNADNNNMVLHLGTYAYNNPGVYNAQATITNGCGLSATQDIMLTIQSGAQIEDAGFFVETDGYTCIGEQLTFRGYGGNEFFWNFGDNSGLELSSTALEAVTHSYDAPGVYTVTMVARNNCGDTMMVMQDVIVPNSEMQIITNTSNSNCLQADGTAVAYVVGTNAPFSYTWSSGQTTSIINNVSAGIYIVNVTDSKGCTDFAIATVSDAQAPTIAVSNVVPVSCHGEDNGAIDITPIGNTAGIIYEWSNGEISQDISGLVAGPYEVIVTNGQGCIAVESVTVTEPDGVTLEFSSSPATCGYMNGSASAIVTGTTGPYLYVWSNGQSGATATNLGPGVYEVTVIDNESCLTIGSVAISETNAPGIILDSLIDVGCGSGGSGIYISPIGGTSPYTFEWSTGSTSDDEVGLDPGQYTLKVTGSDGCESNAIYQIEYQNPDPNPICLVTVTTAQNNKIAWEKVAFSGVASYNIYKESSSAGLYYLIGNVPYDSLSVFIDTISNPAVQAYRYKISAVDSCGTESYISSHHKTIHLTQNIGISGEVNLIWDNYEGFNYATFNIMRYDNITGWQLLTSVPSNINSYSDLNAPLGLANSLHYLVEIELPLACVSTKVENNNTTRSNRTEAISGPIDVNGLEALLAENDIHVYPNPTAGELNIYLNLGNVQTANCQLLDAQGRVVVGKILTQISDGEVITMDPRDAQTGIYVLRIDTGEKVYHRRVLIQK